MAFLIFTLLQQSEDLFDIVIGAVFALFLVGALGLYIYRRLRLRLGTGSWNMANATIVTCFATTPGRGDTAIGLHGGLIGTLLTANDRRSRAVLQYSYTVAGEFYSGSFMLGGSFHSRKMLALLQTSGWERRSLFVTIRTSLTSPFTFALTALPKVHAAWATSHRPPMM